MAADGLSVSISITDYGRRVAVPGRISTSEQCCSAHSSVVRTRSAALLHDAHALNDSTSAELTSLNWALDKGAYWVFQILVVLLFLLFRLPKRRR